MKLAPIDFVCTSPMDTDFVGENGGGNTPVPIIYSNVLTLALAGAVQVCHEKRILAEYADVLAHPRFKFDPNLRIR